MRKVTFLVVGVLLLPGCSLSSPYETYKRSYRVACIQFDTIPEKNERNAREMERLSRAAAAMGAEIIMFHEGSLTDYVSDVDKYSEYVPDGPSCKRLEAVAKELKTHISFGLSEKTKDKHYYITQVFYGPKGFLYSYRKTWIHRQNEDKGYRNEWARYDVGTGPEIFNIAGLRATCFICADGTAPRCIERARLLQPDIVFYSNNRAGYLGARADFAEKAALIKAPMLVTNRIGKSWMYECKGGCAVISGSGEFLAQTDPNDGERILIYDLPVPRRSPE
jgi:predicted amidohydrolase